MKNFILLTASLLFMQLAFGQGDAPPFTKGQAQTGKNLSSVISVPNHQSTKVTGGALLELGNANILKDPSLEGANNSSAWVFTGGTLTIDNTPIHGLINGQIDTTATSLSMTQSSTLYQAQFADGVQGLASMRVRVPSSITTPIYVCSIQNGVEGSTSSGCVQVQANGKWGLYKVPFILGATSNGIALTSKGVSYTGTIEWDDAFVGAVDLKQDVDASRFVGSVKYPQTASCDWATTSATIANYAAAAACPVATVSGGVTAPATKIPGLIIPNYGVGEYLLVATGAFYNGAAANVGKFRFSDGTNTSSTTAVYTSSTNAVTTTTVMGRIRNTSSQSNITIQMQGASSNGVSNSGIYTGGIGNDFELAVYYFPGSGSVYSSTNADTDWASCTPNSYNGLGTPTSVEIQCKREGGDLLMKGKLTLGTVTAAEARVGLPVWNGVQLTSSGTSRIPSLQLAGTAIQASASAASFYTVIEPSVTYFVFTYQSAGAPATTKSNASAAFASSIAVSFNARIPINGWENSNVIIGSFNGLESCTDTKECTDSPSAIIGTGVSASVSNEMGDFLPATCTKSGTNNHTITCTPNSGWFTVTPNCSCNVVGTAGSGRSCTVGSTSTASSLVFHTQVSGVEADASVSISCSKQGADYIGKTAKAVASDQNLRTPSVTNAVFLSAEVSSAGVVSQEDSDFINGSCAVTDTSLYTCTWVSSYWASAPKCIPNVTNGSQNFKAEKEAIPTTTSGVFRTANSTTGGKAASGFTLHCHGVKL